MTRYTAKRDAATGEAGKRKTATGEATTGSAAKSTVADSASAPPPAASLGDGLARVLDSRWMRYRAQRESLLGRFSEPAVHDLRVALRRLMTVLQLLHRLRVLGRPRALKRRLKARFKSLSRLRDVQVERRLLADTASDDLHGFSEHLQDTEARLTAQARRQVEDGADAAVAGHMARVRDGLARYHARKDGKRRLRRGLGREVDRLARRAERRLGRVRARRPRTVHRLRLAFKAYRYALEAIAELQPAPELEALLPDAKSWQTRMGDIQDSRVLTSALAAYRLDKTQHVAGLRKAGQHMKAGRMAALEDFCERLEDMEAFLKVSRMAAHGALRQATARQEPPGGTTQPPHPG
jgi:CHAD domain-containing protein